MEYGNITTFIAELKFNYFPPPQQKQLQLFAQNEHFCTELLYFSWESLVVFHCAQILSTPANQLSLKEILGSYGSESLEEHLWKLLWCSGTILTRVPSMDSGKEFANALKGSVFVSWEVCSDWLPMINDRHLLAWEKRHHFELLLRKLWRGRGMERHSIHPCCCVTKNGLTPV